MVYTKQEVVNFALQNEGLRDWLVRYTSTTDDTHMNRIVRGYTIVHAKHAAERQCPEGYKVGLVSPTTKHWVETLEPTSIATEQQLQQLKEFVYRMGRINRFSHINYDDYDYWS